MSDDDSDWGTESDSDHPDVVGFAPPPVPGGVPPMMPLPSHGMMVVAPAHAEEPMPESLKEEESSAPVPQQIFLGVPVQITQQGSTTAKPQVAGVTVLYAMADNSWKFLVYDQQRRPIMLLPIDASACGGSTLAGKKKSFTAPANFTLLAEGIVTTVDNLGRGYELQFRNRQESWRTLTFLAIAATCAKAQAGERMPFSLVDVMEGTGKGCKTKQEASVTVRAWRVQIDNGSNLDSPGAANLTAPMPPHLATFDPAWEDAKFLVASSSTEAVEDPPLTGCPTSLGQVVKGMKEGSQRCLVVPCNSELAKNLLCLSLSEPEHMQQAIRPGYLLVLSLQVTAFQKAKKEKKEKSTEKAKKGKKSRKSTLTATAPDPPPTKASPSPTLPVAEPPAAVAADSAQSEDEASEEEELAPASSSSSSSSSPGSAEIMKAFASFSANVSALGSTQPKILKRLLTTSYEGIVSDLGLKSIENDSDKTIHKKKEGLGQVKTHILSVVDKYKDTNTADASGTIKSVIASCKQFSSQLEQFAQNGGGGGGASSEALQTAEKRAKAAESEAKKYKKQLKECHALLKAAEGEKANAVRQVSIMTDKQMKLAEENVEMEERLGKVKKLQKENEDLKNKTEMLSVFEQGMVDMRKLLEEELEAKRKLEEQLEELTKKKKGWFK